MNSVSLLPSKIRLEVFRQWFAPLKRAPISICYHCRSFDAPPILNDAWQVDVRWKPRLPIQTAPTMNEHPIFILIDDSLYDEALYVTVWTDLCPQVYVFQNVVCWKFYPACKVLIFCMYFQIHPKSWKMLLKSLVVMVLCPSTILKR